jgi:hypothetical protein
VIKDFTLAGVKLSDLAASVSKQHEQHGPGQLAAEVQGLITRRPVQFPALADVD